MLHRLAFAALSLALVLAAPLARAEDKLDRAAVETIIKDYLLKNPEVLEEALTELQSRRAAEQENSQKQALREMKDQIYNPKNGVVLGNPEGDVTLVEFFDYNCGYCKRGLADILKLLDDDKKLKIILTDYPVLGPGSIEAATVAVAVKQQIKGDKFLAFHKELLGTRGPVGKDRAMEVARNAGVDMTRLDSDIAAKEVRTILTGSLKMGDALGISGTPSYVLGDEVVVGAVGYNALQGKIASMRNCGKTSC